MPSGLQTLCRASTGENFDWSEERGTAAISAHHGPDDTSHSSAHPSSRTRAEAVNKHFSCALMVIRRHSLRRKLAGST